MTALKAPFSKARLWGCRMDLCRGIARGIPPAMAIHERDRGREALAVAAPSGGVLRCSLGSGLNPLAVDSARVVQLGSLLNGRR